MFHSKGQVFKEYLAEDMQLIIDKADKHILYHRCYFNSAKSYLINCNDYSIVDNFKYGDNIPEEY
jgi:hypothetical protein